MFDSEFRSYRKELFSIIATKSSEGKEPQIQAQDVNKFVSQLKFIPDGKVMKIIFCEYDEKFEKETSRSIAQNKYYHKLLDIISEYTGDDHMELHYKLKVRFLARPYILDNKEYTVVGSTAQLTTKNFSEYLEKIFNWASEELGLVLPSPQQF